MNKYSAFLGALLWAATTSLALAQPVGGIGSSLPGPIGGMGSTLPGPMGSTLAGYRPLPTPVPAVAPVTPLPAQPLRPGSVNVGTCDSGGCWGMDGTRYNRAGGNLLQGSNGQMCRFVAPGAPLACT